MSSSRSVLVQTIFEECKRTIQELTALEFADGRDARRFFARRKRAFCSDIVNDVVCSWSVDDGLDGLINEEIDDVLQAVQELFGFENINSLIRSSVYIVPLLLLTNPEMRPIAVKFLDRIRFHLSKHKQDLILEYFPSVLERPLNSAAKKSLKIFIKEYCDLDLRYLFHAKRFLCILYALRSISLDTAGYLEILQGIRVGQADANGPFSLTAVMKYNSEYLGFLLSFRRSLLDDDHYEQRPILLSSLATIIRLIDESFLEEACNKIMVVLRAATVVGEGSVAVWTEFVRRLSDGLSEECRRDIEPFRSSSLVQTHDRRGPIEERCEQHDIKQDSLGCNIFDRSHFYTLERIYTQLQNVDGVLGSFECISACTSPTADERILALEANGDYNEALPLYAQSVNNKELQLIKCLLRLNQPQLALNTATSFYEKEDEEKSPQLVSALASSQLEATWHLRDWSRLEKMVQGNQSQAIGLLTKLLTTKFADMNKLFTSFVHWHEAGAKSSPESPDVLVKRTSRESRAAFAEVSCCGICTIGTRVMEFLKVQLLRAEYMLKSGAVAATDLYQIYLSLQKFDVPSEDLHYRVAVFCDGMYSIDTEKVVLHRSELKRGMLGYVTHGRNYNMNTEISRAFRQLDSYAFYTAFPQLISRIVHPNASVFSTLKAILADLICKYPHQCLWQSIAVYRTGSWQKNIRQERLAEKKIKTCGSFSDLPKMAPRLHNFFARGELHSDLLMGAKDRGLSGMRTVSPSIMIPLTEMLEHALPKDFSDKVFVILHYDLPFT
ncbi:hypothetical protein ANCCEY_13425 [Ancylostoma ceylanicum]|uniref:FAT domain-containing protein n=1 Tax=Ancylostoma ceylanicum TaxID=53326 RepID=A0A0D6LCC9_9BILA|nr:hypothetical protein ANCCEY_13425 [Ancylostoma ceylanicum]